MRKIYLASSWRNVFYPATLHALYKEHDLYDFRNPAKGNTGFTWDQLDPNWKEWIPHQYAEILKTSAVANRGFWLDMDALNWCDTCVLLLPSGRSAHLEAGYAVGAGKEVYVYIPSADDFQPDLMYLMTHGLFTDLGELQVALQNPLGITQTMGGKS